MDKISCLHRRHFIKDGVLSTAGLLFASHLSAEGPILSSKEKQHLISEIKLNAKASPYLLIEFYNGLIGLEVLDVKKASCSFRAGDSILTFSCNPEDEDSPFYHFAFNIPEKKIRQAEEWQFKRTSLIEPPDHLKDLNNYSKNIVHFRHWNAHSIFFYDPVGNVVEYIARHTDPNPALGVFSTRDILCISEIGLVVDNIEEVYADVFDQFGIRKYSTSSDQFMAMGNKLGLILLMGTGTKAAFRKGRTRGIYKTRIILNSHAVKGREPLPRLDFQKYPYSLHAG